MNETELKEGYWYYSFKDIERPVVEYIGMTDEINAEFKRIGSEESEITHHPYLMAIPLLRRFFQRLNFVKLDLVENHERYFSYYDFHSFVFESNNELSECAVYKYDPNGFTIEKLVKRIKYLHELQELLDINRLGTNENIVKALKYK